MNNMTPTTNDGIAPASDTPRTRTYTEIAAFGNPICKLPASGEEFKELELGTFTIKTGGANVMAQITVDDEGDLTILDSAENKIMSISSKVGADWPKTQDSTYWQKKSDLFFLPAGTYTLTGNLKNVDMGSSNVNNLAYFRYEVVAQYTEIINDNSTDNEEPVVEDDMQEEPPVCNPCGCCSPDGGPGNKPSEPLHSEPGAECPGSVEPSGNSPASAPAAIMLADDAGSTPVAGLRSTTMRRNSIWGWKAQLHEGVLTIRPTTGRRMSFAVQEGSSVALPTGLTRHHSVRVELQNADLSACTTGSPAFWTLTEASGRRVRFETATGTVAAVVAASGKVTTVAEHSAQVQENFDAAGNLLSCYSPTQGLMLTSVDESGATVLSWYTPAQVSTDSEGNYTTTGEPYKTAAYTTTLVNGVETTTVLRQQAGLPAHSVTHVVDGDTVTITKGTGEDAIIRTWVTTYPEPGMTQRVETVRRGSADAAPASCSCQVRKLSAGGWLTISETEGYGTNLARTTTYEYNAQFLVSRINHPDGGYTEYEYDADGRVTKETTPWGNGGKNRTRYVYNANSTRFYDTRPVKVYTDYQDAGSTAWLNIKVVDYTYADSAAAERTTAVTHIAGTSQVQTSIEESYGESPAYAYAAGKPKFSQEVDGVQTWHDYEATTEHSAVHKHTTTTMAAGALVAAQSRKTEEFIAADDTVTFEQESIWNGTEWLLLSTTAYEYDAQQRVVKTTRGNGRFSTSSWMCCGKLSETDEDGITTTYGYNSAHELVESIRAEVKDGEVVVTPETITTYTRDAAGRTLGIRRDTGAMTTTEATAYDILGRVVSRTDALGRVTTTAYSADGLTTTVTTPAGATTITQQNPDGSTARISGTAQREVVYTHSVQGNCLCEMQQLADGTIIAQTTTNGFGQVVVQAQPNTQGGFICTRSEYNAKGQLVKTWADTGLDTTPTAATLYEYDAMGNVVKQTLALAEQPSPENSPITETSFGAESLEDGVYSITTTTRYNAAGQPLSSVQKQLISQLSPTLESKSVFVSERGLTSTQWTEYSAGTKRLQYSTVPGSAITAETVTVDGVVRSQKDTAGITTTATRSYTANGMVLTQTDGRGNTTTTVTDKAGRALMVTDAAGNVTTTVYCDCCDQPATITDAQGNTTCYRYDIRGRKVAEWGTGIQPAVFGYDDAGNMVTLTTFRHPGAVISSDPAEWEGLVQDTTTWTFDPATGLELRKTYADNTAVVKTYDAHNRLATETNARGKVKVHSYEHARGLLLNTTWYHPAAEGEEAVADSYSPSRSFTYNHLGQLTQVTDDAGVRSIGYNQYGEQETDSLVADNDTHLITETRDALGRSTGYVYSKNGAAQQTVTTGYGTDGRIASAGFLHGGSEKLFSYEYLPGTHLLQKLTLPSNMTLTQSYEPQRDLLTGMCYKRSNTTVAERTYTYDALGRPLTRTTSRGVQSVTDSFGYNNRSELITATVNNGAYAYDYDNIGNRKTAQENAEEVTGYQSNELNQYTAISVDDITDFVPEYDADGNQTRVKTSTGIWAVNYDSENRPIDFYRIDSTGGTTVHCTYDHMGRRATKLVTVGNNVTLHQRYIYRGYLQIACIDLTRAAHPALWYITWDPTRPVATRPLAIQLNGTWYTYGWDLTKNICELYGQHGYIRTAYTYAPYGQVSEEGDVTQPIQWSSEFNDTELGLIYYNYRHYNPVDGRWIGRDPATFGNNIINYVDNMPINKIDMLGLYIVPCNKKNKGKKICELSKIAFSSYLRKDKPASESIEATEYYIMLLESIGETANFGQGLAGKAAAGVKVTQGIINQVAELISSKIEDNTSLFDLSHTVVKFLEKHNEIHASFSAIFDIKFKVKICSCEKKLFGRRSRYLWKEDEEKLYRYVSYNNVVEKLDEHVHSEFPDSIHDVRRETLGIMVAAAKTECEST